MNRRAATLALAMIFLLPLMPLAARADSIPGPEIRTWGTYRYGTLDSITVACLQYSGPYALEYNGVNPPTGDIRADFTCPPDALVKVPFKGYYKPIPPPGEYAASLTDESENGGFVMASNFRIAAMWITNPKDHSRTQHRPTIKIDTRGAKPGRTYTINVGGERLGYHHTFTLKPSQTSVSWRTPYLRCDWTGFCTAWVIRTGTDDPVSQMIDFHAVLPGPGH